MPHASVWPGHPHQFASRRIHRVRKSIVAAALFTSRYGATDVWPAGLYESLMMAHYFSRGRDNE